MALPWEDSEKFNYTSYDNLITDIVGQELRKVFKQEWNKRYQMTHGAWDDKAASGKKLFNLEQTRHMPQKRKSLFKLGNTSKWDCGLLFDAILDSKCIGLNRVNPLDPVVKNQVKLLRKMRNEVKYIPEGAMPYSDFQTEVSKLKTAFEVARLPEKEIHGFLAKISCYISFAILPPLPTHQIVKRTGRVLEIIANLHQLYDTNDGKLTYFYISGNPGSGKSQLARQVAEEVYSTIMKNPEGKYFVMTLNGRDLNSFFLSYREFCRLLLCDETILKQVTDAHVKIENKIRSLGRLLSSRIKNWKQWLIVVDNVGNLAEISKFLPLQRDEIWKNGQIIITTQDSSAITDEYLRAGHKSISAGMTLKECRELLSSLSSSKSDDETLNEVAKHLDYQPLLLAAACEYLRKVTGSMSTKEFFFADYLKKVDEGKRFTTEKELLETNEEIYMQTISAPVLLAVEKAWESDWIIREIFELFSHISFESLPFDIIFHYLQKKEKKKVDRKEIVQSIQQCSLFIYAEDKNLEFLVHRVVHQAIKTFVKRQAKSKGSSMINVARSLFLFEKKKTDKINSMSHLKNFLHSASDSCTNLKSWNTTYNTSEKKELLKLFETFEDILCNCCEYKTAIGYAYLRLMLIKFLNESLSTTAISFYQRIKTLILVSFFNRNGVALYDKLGCLHRRLGEYEIAKHVFKQTLEMRVERLGSNHVDVALSYNNLSNVHCDLGDLQQAKEYRRQALDIQLNVLGRNHVMVASLYSSLGKVVRELGDLQQAEEYYHQALEIRLNVLGLSNVCVSLSYWNLGRILRDLGDLQQAKEYQHQALEIGLNVSGPNNVWVALSCRELGKILRDLGDLQQAKEYHHQALDILLKIFGPTHIDVATSYNNLGIVLDDLRDFQLAKKYHHQALDIQLNVLGQHHANVALSYNNLANVHGNRGDLKRAKRYQHKALDILLKVLGPNHVDVASSYNNLGNIYRDLGDLQQAKEYHHQALDILLNVLCPNHVNVASSYNNLVIVLGDLGDLQQAREYHLQAVNIRLRVLGASHANVASLYNNLGNVLCDLGDSQQVKAYHHQALDILLDVIGPNHVARSYENLSFVHGDLGDLQLEKKYSDQAQDFRLQALIPDCDDVASSYNNLAIVLGDLGDLRQAKVYHHLVHPSKKLV